MNFADNILSKTAGDLTAANVGRIQRHSRPAESRFAFSGFPDADPAHEYSGPSLSLIGLSALQFFADAVPAELVILDASGHIIIENSAWRRMRASAPRPGIGDDCSALGRFIGNEKSGRRFNAQIGRVLAGEQVSATRKFTSPSKRKVRHYLIHARKMPHPNNDLVLVINNDISELQRLRQQRRLLTDRLVRSEELERQRIAREMHDSTVQDLVAIGLNLRRLAHLAGDELVNEVCSDIRDILKKAQEDIRTMSYLLHPPSLDEGGLMQALRELIRGLSQRMDVRIHLETELGFERFPEEAEMALYRVVQEALINVHLHAQADEAVVRCSCNGQRLTIMIEDNGIGFENDQTPLNQPGMGINGMRSRLSQLHGKLTITSLNPGTRLTATLPAVPVQSH